MSKQTTKPKKQKDTSQKYIVSGAQIRSISQSITAKLKQNPSGGKKKQTAQKKKTSKKGKNGRNILGQGQPAGTPPNVQL